MPGTCKPASKPKRELSNVLMELAQDYNRAAHEEEEREREVVAVSV